MTDYWKKISGDWQDSVNVLAGLWLVISPWVLQFQDSRLAVANAVLLGGLIALMSLAAVVNFRNWEEWLDMAVGAWLVISPWVLGLTALTFATWNFVIIGAIVLALAAWSLYEHGTGYTV
ncbi:SPW repeat protein [Cribrihabitans pelagius]|uniref:SPW repeat protein n=1 Tax=Cribrihabitans pelagius TaxID=1765746 RepID=UPI003B5CCC88